MNILEQLIYLMEFAITTFLDYYEKQGLNPFECKLTIDLEDKIFIIDQDIISMVGVNGYQLR